MYIHTGFNRAAMGKGLTGSVYFAWNSATYDLQRGGQRILDTGNNEFSYAVEDIDLKAIAQTDILPDVISDGQAFVITSLEVVTKSITGAAAMPTIQFGMSDAPAGILAPVQLDAGMNVAWAREQWDPASLLADVAVGSITDPTFQFGVTVAGLSTTHVGIVIVKGLLF